MHSRDDWKKKKKKKRKKERKKEKTIENLKNRKHTTAEIQRENMPITVLH